MKIKNFCKVVIILSVILGNEASALFGGSNIFNNKGGDSTRTAGLGRLHSQFAPMGFNGAFWYAAYRRSF